MMYQKSGIIREQSGRAVLFFAFHHLQTRLVIIGNCEKNAFDKQSFSNSHKIGNDSKTTFASFLFGWNKGVTLIRTFAIACL